MYDHPFPQDERQESAVFRCVVCDFTFTDLIPGFSQTLPNCEVCLSPAWLCSILSYDHEHHPS